MIEVVARLRREVATRSCGHTGEMVLNFPEKWDELTPKQLLYIAQHWLHWQELARYDRSMIAERAALVLELCGLQTRRQKRKLCLWLGCVDERTDVNILERTHFLFKNTGLTRNLLPTILSGPFDPFDRLRDRPFDKLRGRIGGPWFSRRYYGPADLMKDCTINEFSFAFGCYSLYNQSKQEKYLDSLVAVLYRPKNKNYLLDGQLREPFNNKKMRFRENRIKKLNPKYRVAVMLFFDGVLEHLKARYPLIFRRAEAGARAGGSFHSTLMEMSGGVFVELDKILEQDMYMVLDRLQKVVETNEREHRGTHRERRT